MEADHCRAAMSRWSALGFCAPTYWKDVSFWFWDEGLCLALGLLEWGMFVEMRSAYTRWEGGSGALGLGLSRRRRER